MYALGNLLIHYFLLARQGVSSCLPIPRAYIIVAHNNQRVESFKMFTGIVEGLGKIEGLLRIGEGLRLGIRPLYEFRDPQVGESISVDGVCLTLVDWARGVFSVDVSHESLLRSTLRDVQVGNLVNLERALKVGDRLGGHFVTGHVDCVGVIMDIKRVERSRVMRIEIEKALSAFVVEKGSIAIDGISLTVNGCGIGWIETNIIPHTFEVTTLKNKGPGSKVNIEVDILGKYVYSILTSTRGRDVNKEKGITLEKLQEYGWR